MASTADLEFLKPRVLGRSGLVAGRLGFGSSYGAPATAYEMAFEQGFNYFYWGSYRRDGMRDAIRNLALRHREKIITVVQSYSRFPHFLSWSTYRALKQLKLDYTDVLLLGWYDKPPKPALMDVALALKEKGLVRKLAISCHNRPLFETYIQDPRFDIIMVRYNAAHRGAEREVFPHLSKANPRPGVVTYTTTRWGYLINPKYTPPGMKTPTASDCYRFALSNPHVDLCLSGPATLEEMQINLRDIARGPLSEDEMKTIKTVGDHVHKLTAKGFLSNLKNPFMQRQQ